jgi:alkanesulfonate monooxygenase SsuD/methylene tetrahydromethanopterin reductase-like flavin-dependent oxidoreductase (luciferase family)
MKVGVLQFFSWPERRTPLKTVYDRALQRIDVMERTGYDTVWLAEHHFSTYSVCPSVHLMGMHVADRTVRLRVGMAVTLASFYHPLRIAEEVALLDVLSGGRVSWGAGRGFDRTEYQAFGVTEEESYPRFREHVDIVRRAWTTDRLTFHGSYWDFDDVEVLPKPLQQPHPPMWVAASSPDAVEWCAKEGYSILMDPHSSHAEIGRKRHLYEEALVAAGHPTEGRDIPMARLLAVAPTDAEAEDIARRGAQWTVGAYANPAKRSIVSATATEAGPPGHQADPVTRYVDDVILWGSPARVADKLAELRETIDLRYLMCAPLSHSSFELFTEQILPKVL